MHGAKVKIHSYFCTMYIYIYISIYIYIYIYSGCLIIFLLVWYCLSISYCSCNYSLVKTWFPEHGTCSCFRAICEWCAICVWYKVVFILWCLFWRNENIYGRAITGNSVQNRTQAKEFSRERVQPEAWNSVSSACYLFN